MLNAQEAKVLMVVPMIAIGEHTALSPRLRTKANAEHAGHSQPLVHWKELTSLILATHLPLYQSNN